MKIEWGKVAFFWLSFFAILALIFWSVSSMRPKKQVSNFAPSLENADSLELVNADTF